MTDDSPKNMKKCFVIGPIGKAGSDTRNKADYLLEYIIKPAVFEHSYYAFRADEVTEPGMISDQVIIDTLESDLVIADLTSHNANAFYELGIRHTGSNKPTIHMILEGQDPPFDVKGHRYITYRIDNPSDLSSAMQKLSEVVGSLGSDPEIQNPVTRAKGVRSLASSEDSRDRIVASQNEKIDRLERKINHLLKTRNPGILERIANREPVQRGISRFDISDDSLDTQLRKELGLSGSPTDVTNPGGLLGTRDKHKD